MEISTDTLNRFDRVYSRTPGKFDERVRAALEDYERTRSGMDGFHPITTKTKRPVKGFARIYATASAGGTWRTYCVPSTHATHYRDIALVETPASGSTELQDNLRDAVSNLEDAMARVRAHMAERIPAPSRGKLTVTQSAVDALQTIFARRAGQVTDEDIRAGLREVLSEMFPNVEVV